MTHLVETVNNSNPNNAGIIDLNVSDINNLNPTTSSLLGVDSNGDFSLTSGGSATLGVAFSADLFQGGSFGTANYNVNNPLDYRDTDAVEYNDGTVTTSRGLYSNWTGTWQLGAGQYIVHARWSSRSNASGKMLFRLFNKTDSTYHGNYTRLGKGRASCTVHAYLNLTGTKQFQFRVTQYTSQVQYMTNKYQPAVHVKFYRLA